jgi:phosphotransferase system enzyme I (PtsI)
MGTPEFNLEIEALSKIASHRPSVKLALPFVISVGEVRRAEDELARANVSMDVGIVIETPAAVSIVDRLAELAKFVLVDIDHLAELMLATEKSSSSYDSKHEAIFNAVKGVIKICKSKNVPVYICGTEAEHSDFDSVLEGSKVIFTEEKSFKPETSVLSW